MNKMRKHNIVYIVFWGIIAYILLIFIYFFAIVGAIIERLFTPKMVRLVKFCFIALIVYFCVKAPIMWVFTDLLHLHYVISGAISGAVVSIAQFLPSDWWFWTRKKSPS